MGNQLRNGERVYSDSQFKGTGYHRGEGKVTRAEAYRAAAAETQVTQQTQTKTNGNGMGGAEKLYISDRFQEHTSRT